MFRRIQKIHNSAGMCDTERMAWVGVMVQTVWVIVEAAERERLAAIVADRNRPRKHVERARIVLASTDRGSVAARQTG